MINYLSRDRSRTLFRRSLQYIMLYFISFFRAHFSFHFAGATFQGCSLIRWSGWSVQKRVTRSDRTTEHFTWNSDRTIYVTRLRVIILYSQLLLLLFDLSYILFSYYPICPIIARIIVNNIFCNRHSSTLRAQFNKILYWCIIRTL